MVSWCPLEARGLLTRLKGLHMEMAAEIGVFGPSSPRYRTRMFAAHITIAQSLTMTRNIKANLGWDCKKVNVP